MVSYETIAVKLLSDADVNVSVVAQNFLMVKMARLVWTLTEERKRERNWRAKNI